MAQCDRPNFMNQFNQRTWTERKRDQRALEKRGCCWMCRRPMKFINFSKKGAVLRCSCGYEVDAGRSSSLYRATVLDRTTG